MPTYGPDYYRRVPTTSSVLWGIDLPYRPPKSALGAFLWRRRLWLETTFGLSVLEPWEKICIVSVIYLIIAVVLTWTFGALPQQLTQVSQRTMYYVFGDMDVGSGAGTRLVWVKWKAHANGTWNGEL